MSQSLTQRSTGWLIRCDATVFSYKISILKSMLPDLLNSQYDKVIMATDKLDEEDKQTFLQRQDHVLFSQLSEEQRQAIPRLVQSGRVTG